MIIREICRYPRAKGVVYSKKFIATATGQRAYVYDRITNRQLACFEKLSYAYKAYITPDEKMLIVRGTTHFIWFFSLEEMTLIKRISIKESNSPQDSGSTVSPDGRYFYYIVYTNDLLSVLIKIDLLKLEIVDRFFADQRWVMHNIQYIPTRLSYLINGYERPEPGDEVSNNKDFLLWFDGEKAAETIWPNVECRRVQYDPDNDQIFALSFYPPNIHTMDVNGQMIRTFKLDLKKPRQSGHKYLVEFAFDEKTKLICAISNGALYVLDAKTWSVLASLGIKGGLLDLQTLDEGIAVLTFSGDTIIYRLE